MAKILRNSSHRLSPLNGSVVCCDIYGTFIHTGIWLNGGIVELAGSGLVRHVSPNRFLQGRSGDHIFTLGNDNANVLNSQHAAQSAKSRIYEYINYDVMSHNCNRFVATCFNLPQSREVMFFSELTEKLSNFFQCSLVFYKINTYY